MPGVSVVNKATLPGSVPRNTDKSAGNVKRLDNCTCVGELVVEEEKETEEEELIDLHSSADSSVSGADEERSQMDEEEAGGNYYDVQPEPGTDLLTGGELTDLSAGLTPGQVSRAAEEPVTAVGVVPVPVLIADDVGRPVATPGVSDRERVGARATDEEAAGAEKEPEATAVQTTVPEILMPATVQTLVRGRLQSASRLRNQALAVMEESQRLGATAKGKCVSRVTGPATVTRERIAIAMAHGVPLEAYNVQSGGEGFAPSLLAEPMSGSDDACQPEKSTQKRPSVAPKKDRARVHCGSHSCRCSSDKARLSFCSGFSPYSTRFSYMPSLLHLCTEPCLALRRRTQTSLKWLTKTVRPCLD
ncbi:uncharacterized protein LOC116401075 [Anarrhichthys ocellatus]|uniref:uncharacterized protein LOC116401075 n=1 Tax=Anarrhichthys ocellatus TaxID=433405 RepID=UPI0012EE7322|nr:uncharacterized protein LOC116401075 [Anarrhichthys ocellatus]